LTITSRARMPIAEVSGLGHRRMPSGEPSFLAIGDATPTIVTFDLDDGGRPRDVVSHDVRPLVGAAASQWEAVAGDGEGQVFVLTEGPSPRITAFDAKLTRVLHTFELSGVPSAEGLVLLANGHILVANEKEPTFLAELAPAGEPAGGFRADLALAERGFPLPKSETSRLSVVKQWSFKDKDAAALGDISDVALDAENRLVLLGDQSRIVIRIERELSPLEARIDAKLVFHMPSVIDKPEGLVFAGDGTAIIGTDGKTTKDDALFTVTFPSVLGK
jgi:hypothetical protein